MTISHTSGVSAEAIVASLRRRAAAHQRYSRAFYAAAKHIPASTRLIGNPDEEENRRAELIETLAEADKLRAIIKLHETAARLARDQVGQLKAELSEANRKLDDEQLTELEARIDEKLTELEAYVETAQ